MAESSTTDFSIPVLRKRSDIPRDKEKEKSYICEHGTEHFCGSRAPMDSLEELREFFKMDDKDFGELEKFSKLSNMEKEAVLLKAGKKNLNRSQSLPLTNRLKSKKRFVVPRNSVDESAKDMFKVPDRGSLSRQNVLRDSLKDPVGSNSRTGLKRDKLKNFNFDLPSHSLSESDDDWDDSDSDSDSVLSDTCNSIRSTTERNPEDTNSYEEALIRGLMLFNDLEDDFDEEEMNYFMNLGLPLDHNRLKEAKNKAVPNFPCGPEVIEECLVCFEKMKLRRRLCCDFAVCDECMEKYLLYEVERGVVKIECINGTCDSYVHRDEILGRLPPTMKEKYYRFLVDANKDPNVKTCPRCSHIYNRLESGVLESHGKFGVLVQCPDCNLGWCFECQAPWHATLKCKDFRRGDNLLKSWAREQHFGHQNAQRCPRCKIFIERKGGCDHMVCTKCNTGFCYRCGDRFIDLKFFGNHLSRLSPLGCKYNYKPDEPVKRRLVRGSLLGVKLLGGVLLVGLGLAAGAVLVGASVVILPVLGGYKYHKFRKIRKRHRKQQKLFSLRTRRAMMESLREQAVLEYVTERQRIGPQREPRDGPVHIGIQTGPSQQVDVTVHNPYQPDGPRDEANLNSEITMDIRDDEGHVTRTTAEVKPGGSTDEGEVVLHVKTQYSNPAKENPDLIKDSEKAGEKETGLEASGKSSAFGSVSSRSSSSHSSKKSGAGMKTKNKKSRKNSGPHSEREKRDVHKTENDHSMKKNKENVSNNETGTVSPPLPDLGLKKSLNSPQEEEGKRLDDTDQTNPMSHSETGCFLKLFSKKLQSLEKEKYTIPRSESKETDHDLKDKDLQDCPDIVSCTLQAAFKTQETEYNKEKDRPAFSTQSSSSSGDLDLDSSFCDHDPYLGMISTETYKTFL